MHTVKSKVIACALFVVGLLVLPESGLAGTINFSASQGGRAASASFEAVGGDLVVTLTNTSTDDALVPVDILTGVFFDIATPGPTLTPVTAVLAPGSSVLFGGTDPGNVVGGEWGYNEGLSGAPGGAAYGISSSGLGLFGPPDLFPGSNLQGPSSPDGLQYGITSAGDDPLTGNTPVTGTNALIKNSVVFTLSGLPMGFDPMVSISNIQFQYGTDLSEPHFPEPSTMALLGFGAVAVLRRRR